MRVMAMFVLVCGLSGCGAVYYSPLVPADDPNVMVVSLTHASAAHANQSQYTPKSLPVAFYQNAGGGGALRGAGPTPEPIFEAQVRPDALPLRLPPNVPQSSYEIGVGDVVLLATPSAGSSVEELTGLLAAQNRRQGYTVQDDGAIAIPDVGRVDLAGLTVEEAEAEVFQTLVSNQIDPSFSIEVSEFNSQRVSVGGGVSGPSVVPITLTSLTLEEALAASGGIDVGDQDYASIRLYRDGELYQIPLNDYYSRPALQKTRLVGGDSIFVDTSFQLAQAQAYFQEQITLTQFRQQARVQALAELNAEVSLRRASLEEARSNFTARLAADAVDRDYVYLAGEVVTPGRFPLPFEQRSSLADALLGEAGMNTRTANPQQIYLLRGQDNSDQVTAYNLDVTNATRLVLATRMELRPNDIIFVAEQPVTRWDRVVQQITPSLITSSVAAVSN
ncbi:MAG: polysaccharide biosynthesis/export family protein [Pseudomonadota bacterium]